MAKGKPRWKELSFHERLLKRLKQHGVSDEMCEYIRERGKKKGRTEQQVTAKAVRRINIQLPILLQGGNDYV